MNVQPLIDAIDRYLAKADDELEEALSAEGFIEPKKTVKEANAVEEEMADILSEQTEDLLDVLDNSTEDNLQSNVDAMLEADDIAEVVAETSLTLYESLVPALANAYMQEAEGDLVINTLRQRTTDWFNVWSEQLGELTKISTHKQISDLIKKAIEDGISIDKLARQIRQGGWRSEYYQARRYALTEVLRAHSVAREEAIQQSPSTDRKEWRHTGAHKIKPRANHVAMDKQIVPKEEPFEMQGSDGATYFPMFPRDPSLPACESINCHCIHRGVVNDDILGLSKEERQKMQEDIVAADDGEWKKQLDAQNKAKAGIESPYEAESSKPKYDYAETVINRKAIASSEYRKKYSNLPETKQVQRKVAAEARRMLRHRSGTKYEDLAFINSTTGEVLSQVNGTTESKVKPTRAMKAMLKDADEHTIIGVHNHPGSSAPSYADFVSAYERKYKYGIVACHNGNVYKYTIVGDLNRPMAEGALDLWDKTEYSEDIANMLLDAGIEVEVL